MAGEKSEVLQGDLQLKILRTLPAARRIEQLSEDVLKRNEGTVCTSLSRPQQSGCIAAEGGAPENNCTTKFNSITRSRLKQLAIEVQNWSRVSGVIGRVLSQEGRG